jgi:hypothetical protein
MRAVLIDVVARSLTEIDIPENMPGQLDALHAAVGGWIEAAVGFENGDLIYVDEEGRLAHKGPIAGWFAVKGSRRGPFAGNGILTGNDTAGNARPAETPLAELEKLILFG